MSNLIRAISEDGGVFFCGLDSTALVREMEQIHHTSAVASAALGRVLTAAGMMGALLKSEDDALTLRVKGDGPIGTVLAVANAKGEVKGYAAHPLVDLPPRADGKLNVGGAVGRDGTLTVIRDLGMKEPYVGQVPLVSGEIAEDVTSYYAASEQTPTVCGLGVLVDTDLTIANAGGFLIQLMPDVTEEAVTRLEKNVAALPSVTQMLNSGMQIQDILNRALDGFAPRVLEQREVRYVCGCNEERVRNMLRSLRMEELQEMQQEEEIAEVVCDFCHAQYHIPLTEIVTAKKDEK